MAHRLPSPISPHRRLSARASHRWRRACRWWRRNKPKGRGRPTSSYFLVDPLDGTREFIAGRDEYTVNVALVTDGAPMLGVIAAPAQLLIWRGIVGRGAERMAFAADGKILPATAIHTRKRPEREPVVLVSRSHLDARTQAYLDGLSEPRTIACGSSVKFCRVAEGSADLYPRLGPTHDWDIAAGHAIVEAAGGWVRSPDGGPLRLWERGLADPELHRRGRSAGALITDRGCASRPATCGWRWR